MEFQKEKDFQRWVINLADSLGYRAWHNRDSRGSHAGLPDVIFCNERTFFMAELKRKGGKLSPAQVESIAHLRQNDVEVYVWYPQDCDAIKERLELTKGDRLLNR